MEKAIDLEELRQLISIVERNSIEELVVEEEGVEVVIKAEKPPPPSLPVQVSPALLPAETRAPAPLVHVPSTPPTPSASPVVSDSLVPIVAPLVGVFYRAPGPEDPPFVEEGDWVEIGQIVGTIEAMKIFNDIHAEVRGRVVRVLAANEQLVMQGETLMLLDSEPREGENHA